MRAAPVLGQYAVSLGLPDKFGVSFQGRSQDLARPRLAKTTELRPVGATLIEDFAQSYFWGALELYQSWQTWSTQSHIRVISHSALKGAIGLRGVNEIAKA